MNSYQRPAVSDRSFRSEAVEAFIRSVVRDVSDEQTRRMFVNCYPNTLDTTVQFREQPDGTPDTFVITGDIPAMWLRDSAAQVWPYLHLVGEDDGLRRMIEGVIRRMAKSVLIDPYANAFLRDPGSRDTQFGKDHTTMAPGVYERKWEVDSLAYVLRLSYGYWKNTGRTEPFDLTWLRAIELILKTFEDQRGPDAYAHYTFQRTTPIASDTLAMRGRGNPGRPCGLIRSAFRCSDDASIFPYLIPSNLMAAAELGRIAPLLEGLKSHDLARWARRMSQELFVAVERHGVVDHPVHGRIYAYEVDGYGSTLLMDDAGIPGLLSMPYLGAVDAESPLYRNTRQFTLSTDNPYYFIGHAVAGIGSPHTTYGWVWPMSLLARGLTTANRRTMDEMIATLQRIDAGTGFVHEALDPDRPESFTRTWFSWVNGLFGELVARSVGKPLFTTPFEPGAPRIKPRELVLNTAV